MLESKGIKPQGGTLVNGTFVEVPRQRNTKEEKAQIKNGEAVNSGGRVRGAEKIFQTKCCSDL
jgi:hypothetical protein